MEKAVLKQIIMSYIFTDQNSNNYETQDVES